ncbi:MAG: hypothetical protein WC875_00755 [Candidatus Absconditabacterales bacterium]|jgi:hypothetical protein
MQIFEINGDANPQLKDIHELLSKAIGIDVTKSVTITRMSYDSVIKSLQEGKLKGIEDDMKLSKTNFYHFYTEKMDEVIIQTSPVKLAIFSNLPEVN